MGSADTQEVYGFPPARRPTACWTHKGQLLEDIYDETYGSRDD